MLSDLSVTLVYCVQTVVWIKMKLGMQVGLGSDHMVLDVDPALSPEKGVQQPAPSFRPLSVVARRSPISSIAEHLSILRLKNERR